MGRNSIPKIGEWRDGKMYRFRAVDSMRTHESEVPQPADGRMIVYEVQSGKDGPVEVLGTAFADGFQSVMAAMWEDGYSRGLRAGRAEKLKEVQDVLGIDRGSKT